jgi:hypothetical protein
MSKCKFVKVCKWYDKKNDTCQKDGGYYGGKFAGCYQKNYERLKQNENKK